MMHQNYATAAVLTLLLVFWIWVTVKGPTQRYAMSTAPRTLKTTDSLILLKKVVQERIVAIKRSSGPFTPYNASAMDLVSTAVDKATSLDELGAAFLLLPNNSIGSAPLGPLTGSPEDTTLFQFEQGTMGWYWGYATYEDQPSSGEVANVMYYIIRIDLGTPEIRRKYNLPLGATTIYSVSFGAGFGKGTWRYSPYAMCRGSYDIHGAQSFTFTAHNEDDTVAIAFKADKKEFTLEFSCKIEKNVFATSTTFGKTSNPQFNAPRGCAPCVAGDGTLYWSYPQLGASSSITIGTTTRNFKHGDGWLDHQWMRGNDPLELGVKILTNFSQLKKSVGGLGRYVWLNVHLGEKQFMITAFPPQSAKIEKGQAYPAQYIAYSAHEIPTYKNKTALTFEETTTHDGIIFPTVISVTLPGPDGSETYTLSSIPYGDCVTFDLTGNLHWSGSASLTDSKGKSPGTGFIELNQFQPIDLYRSNMMKKAGIDKSALSTFSDSPLTFVQVIPSILYVLLGLGLFVAIIVFLVLGSRHK
jgi:hypothetical protein